MELSKKNISKTLEKINISGSDDNIVSSGVLKNIQVFDYQPTQAKNIVTGSGRADKKQVMLSVSKILNNQNLLKNEHVADAFSIAICHSIINNSKTKII